MELTSAFCSTSPNIIAGLGIKNRIRRLTRTPHKTKGNNNTEAVKTPKDAKTSEVVNARVEEDGGEDQNSKSSANFFLLTIDTQE